MKRIAIFGGNFDPPHIGHRAVVDNILRGDFADEVLVVPAGDDRYDRQPAATGADRLLLLKAWQRDFFEREPRVKIETAQIDGKLPGSKMIDLVDFLRRSRGPEVELRVAIGVDNLTQVSKWVEGPRLIEAVVFLAFPRPGCDSRNIDNFSGKMVEISGPNVEKVEASSSNIRRRIANRKDYAALIGPRTAALIADRNLYSTAQ